MRVFNRRASIRVDDEVMSKIDELLTLFPDRFESQSQVARAAIIILHRKELQLLNERNKEARKWIL